MTKKNFKQELVNEIFPIITKSAAEIGVEAYVIGGFVRDLMLHKKTPKDIDIVAVGSGIALSKKWQVTCQINLKYQFSKILALP